MACWDHHLGDPGSNLPNRRSADRRAEVVFFASGQEPQTVCAGGAAPCTPSTCELYGAPALYVYEYEPVPASPVAWSARWDRPQVKRGDEAKMRLRALGIAGQSVLFEVTQEGFGKIGEAQAVAGALGAEAPWKDWWHPKRVAGPVALNAGDEFPPVKFTFTATANGRVAASGTIVYADTVRARVVYNIDGQWTHVAEDRDYELGSPWGSRKGKTRKDENGDPGWVIEERLPPGGAIAILGRKRLLSMDWTGQPSARDAAGPWRSGSWRRYCDVKADPPGARVSYRFAAPTMPPDPADGDQAPPGAPPVTFRVRRFLALDAPQSGDVVEQVQGESYLVTVDTVLTPALISESPWMWEFEWALFPGDGVIEVTLLWNGNERVKELIQTRLPLNTTPHGLGA
jgi:hypothetical protein